MRSWLFFDPFLIHAVLLEAAGHPEERPVGVVPPGEYNLVLSPTNQMKQGGGGLQQQTTDNGRKSCLPPLMCGQAVSAHDALALAKHCVNGNWLVDSRSLLRHPSSPVFDLWGALLHWAQPGTC